LNHFPDQCQEQSDEEKNVLIIFKEGHEKTLKDALPYDSEALAMAKALQILRREIMSWKSS